MLNFNPCGTDINEEDHDGVDDEEKLSREGSASSLVDEEDRDADDEAEEEDEEEEEEEDQPGRKKLKVNGFVSKK